MREEEHADAKLAGLGEGDAEIFQVALEELVRELSENAGAVAGFLVGIDGAAMGEIAERLEGVLQDGVGFYPILMGDEPDATGVVFKFRTVQGGPEKGDAVLDDVVHRKSEPKKAANN
jgi:hypothetical protein